MRGIMVDGDGWDTELKKLIDLQRDPGKYNARFELSNVSLHSHKVEPNEYPRHDRQLQIFEPRAPHATPLRDRPVCLRQ